VERARPPEQRLYETSAAAKELGLKQPSLNKLARVYESVYGNLPRGQRHVRLWTPEAIERIRSARLAVKEGRALNTEAALQALEAPKDAQLPQMLASELERAPETLPSLRLLEALVGEILALREAVEDQKQLLGDQTDRLQRLETALLRLPSVPTDTSEKKASLETSHSPESRAEDQKERDEAQRTSTDRRASGGILPIILVTVSIAVTVIAALYHNTLPLTVSLVIVVITFSFSLYYYYAKG
jgi:hypothetical protein